MDNIIIRLHGKFSYSEVLGFAIIRKIFWYSKKICTNDYNLINSYIKNGHYIAIIDTHGIPNFEYKIFANQINEPFTSCASSIYNYFADHLLAQYSIPFSVENKNEIYERYFKYIDVINTRTVSESNIKVRSIADMIDNFQDFDAAYELVSNDMDLFFKNIREEFEKKEIIYPVLRKSNDILYTKNLYDTRDIVVRLEKTVNKDIKYIIDERKDSYFIYGVPKHMYNHEPKIPLIAKWRGLKGNELIRVSGIRGSIFVDNLGYTGMNAKLKGAVEMCCKSLQHKK